ncbi:MAG: MBL fold metallo-hydrolase [Hyphomicrobiales bacterium]|nr:MBL fold metallo-hydrolase [Hyphomicrobiales bacterium]
MHPFKIAIVPVTPFQQNCSIIVCAKTNKAAIVDPGGDLPRIEAALAETGATLEKILITHGHIDHIGATTELARKTGVPIEGPHTGDRALLENLPQIAAGYGFPKMEAVRPDRWLDEGECVTVGALTFDVLHCPGHSQGSVVFVWRKGEEDASAQGFAIVGDVLFRGSVGRTDLPGGSHETLIRMIETKLLPLGDDTAFLPGHGPMGVIGEERQTNPYL